MTKTEKNWPRGCLQIYTGCGKGKTTAALGLSLRAAGAGLRVYFGQFLKNRDCGEVTALQKFPDEITLERFGSGNWVKQASPEEIALAQSGLSKARLALNSEYDVVVLDEILGALKLKLLTLPEVLSLTELRPAQTELVFTGRGAPPELIERADLVSEIKDVKHYYTAGLPARSGIEY